MSKILNFYKFKKFKNRYHTLLAYNQNRINIHTPIWFFWKGFFETEKKEHFILEIQLSKHGNLVVLNNEFQFRYNWYGAKVSQFIFSTAGRIILNDFIK